MGAFIKERARVRTKRMWLLPVGLAVYVIVPLALLAGFVAVCVHLPGPLQLAVFVVGALVSIGALLAILAAVTHVWNHWLRERRGRVRGDEDGLWLDDVLLVRRSSVGHGRVLGRRGGWHVLLVRRVRPVDVVVDDEEEGRALLRHMRLEQESSVARYVMNHGTCASAWWRGALMIPVILGPAALAVLLGASALVFVAVVVASSTYCTARSFVRVAAGVDGVRLRRFSGRARFVSHRELASAETDGRDVTLRLHDGSTIAFNNPSGKGLWRRLPIVNAHRKDDAHLLVARINELRASAREASRSDHALARGTRTTREWMTEVALASDEHASFRQAALAPEQLWRMAEDIGAPSTVRAGAALALRSRLDDDGRARVCALADACASPRLRAALMATTAQEDTPELEAAFHELRDV